MNLSGDLKGMSYGDVLPFMQNPIDPRVFMFRGLATNETTRLLRTHVDDLMLLAERGFKKEIGKDSKLFPPQHADKLMSRYKRSTPQWFRRRRLFKTSSRWMNGIQVTLGM